MRLRTFLAAALALTGGAAGAGTQQEALAESIVELRINGQAAAPTLVVRRDADGALLLRAGDLAALRLRTPPRGAVLVDGERYYRIGSEIGARVIFDEATQSVEIHLPARAFVATRNQYASPDARAPVSTAPGSFINYDLSADHVDRGPSAGGFLELGVFGARGVLTNTLVARAGDEQAGVVRLDTTWTRDFPDRLATLRIGDSISAPGAWGQSVRFAGVQFGTNFSTQPSLVTTPLLAASGEAVVPSTVDVFINGHAVASEQVPPGPFTIDHLPSINGAGQMQVVVVDALGRQQVLTQPYYTSTALLRAGLSEYSVEVGSLRSDYGTRSDRYGDFVGAATIRRGVTDRLTAELHAEGQAGDGGAVGFDTAWQAGLLGIVSLTAAASGTDGGTGWLGGFGFEHSGPHLSAFARTLYSTEAFSRPGDAARSNRPKQRNFAGLGYSLMRLGSLQVVYGLQSCWTAQDVRSIGFTYSRGLGDFGFLNLSANRTDAHDDRSELLLTWTVPFGERRSVSTALRHVLDADEGGGGFEAVSTVQQNLPTGSGSGYSMTISTSEDHLAAYAYQGGAGVARVDYARQNGEDGWRIGAVGGLALTGAGVMPSRRLSQSFAMVQVADYAGLEILVDNQPVGRTDHKGRVLVDQLRPYEANEISLDPTALPMDATLSTAAVNVTPAYRSGALVRFPVSRGDAAILRLQQESGAHVPPGAEVTINGATFPVALNGLVQVTGVADRAAAIAQWRDGRCEFEVVRPASGDPVPDLGTVMCHPLTGEAPQR